MTFSETYERLRELGTEQTRKTYLRHGSGEDTFGVSFAHLGQLKKHFVGRGKDKAHAHAVAQQLWHTGNFDARNLATMIADPQQLSPAEAETWAATVSNHATADALASLVATTDYATDKVADWTSSPGEFTQRLGYSVLARLAAQHTLPDVYFEPFIGRIAIQLPLAANRAKEGMNTCLIAIGSRTEPLRQQVEAAADRIGPVTIDHGDTACQTFAVRPYLQKVWARKATKA